MEGAVWWPNMDATAWGTWALFVATGILAAGVIFELSRYKREQLDLAHQAKRDQEKLMIQQSQLRSEQDQLIINRRNQFYAQLDNVYYDIQRQIIAHPHLGDPHCARTPAQMRQYSAFAYMSFNFVEAICDYSEDDPSLAETWGVVISYEANLHRDWISDDQNRNKFKPKFWNYIAEKVLMPPEAPKNG